MAKRHGLYDQGTPERALQDAVDADYPDRIESFFEDVSDHLKITRETASGAYYGFLRRERGLPPEHRRVYMRLINGLTEQMIEDVAALRPMRPRTTARRSLLEEQVEAMRDVLVQLAESQGLEVPEVLRPRGGEQAE